jgi:predicted transcriptional regulator
MNNVWKQLGIKEKVNLVHKLMDEDKLFAIEIARKFKIGRTTVNRLYKMKNNGGN